MKQDDDHPGLDWAALIKRAASHHSRWKLIQSENCKNTTTMSQDHSLFGILGRQTHSWQFGIPALYTQLSSLFALYYPLKVFNSYRENPERLHFLRSTGLWIIDVLLVEICWLHKRGSLEKHACPMHNCDPFPPVSCRTLYCTYGDAKGRIFRPQIPPKFQPLLLALQ